jgi:hypothetical protein
MQKYQKFGNILSHHNHQVYVFKKLMNYSG